MFNHELFAVSFARSVHVMRQKPPVVAQQKGALRAVYALISIAPATVRVYDGVLSIDDVAIPDNIPNVGELVAQLTAHGVMEIAIARGAAPGDLLALVRAIAVEPGGFSSGDSVEVRVRTSGATSIAVLSVQPSDQRPEGHRGASVTQAFEAAGLGEDFSNWVSAEKKDEVPPTFGTKPTEIDLGFEEEQRQAAAQPEAEAEAPALEAPAEPLPAPHEPAAEELPVDANTPLGHALLAVRRDPYGGNVLDLLSELGHAFSAAMEKDEVVPAVRAVAAAIMLEPGAPEGSPKNSYSIALKRMLTKEAMVQIAALLLTPDEAPVATFVLHRAGAVGADVLLGLLGTAETMRERKAYMHALRGIPSGMDQVVHMLDKPQWFVVRNVAELCGELRFEEAVGDLARLLTHADTRVQRAAAIALAKIGSNATVPPLLKLLRDKNPELRGQVAASIGLRAAPALAMPIAALAADETDPELLREYYKALGRIGTPEAVQALVRAAQAGGRLLSRRPAAVRLAAIEGLKLAAGSATIAALDALGKDGDKAIATAARQALDAVRGGPSEQGSAS